MDSPIVSQELKLELGGQELLETLVNLTGLPPEFAHRELDQILELSGNSAHQLTLEQLREALVKYLEQIESGLISD